MGVTKGLFCSIVMLEVPLTKDNVSKELIHYDSQVTLTRAYSKVYNENSWHIRLRYSLLRKLITDVIISLTYIQSSYNFPDPFTKPLPEI